MKMLQFKKCLGTPAAYIENGPINYFIYFLEIVASLLTIITI